ncbi:MAG: TIM barrel protein [Bryobacteraceae bacterium]
MHSTRRAFTKSLAVLPFASALVPVNAAESQSRSIVNGVHLGAQTYSFRDLLFNNTGDPIDELIAAMKKTGIYECELLQSHTEPRVIVGPSSPTYITKDGKVSEHSIYGEVRGKLPPPSQAEAAAKSAQQKWRETVSLDHFKGIRKKFDAAGMTIHSYNATLGSFGQWWREGKIATANAELERTFEFARALGVNIITTSTTLPVVRQVVPFAEKYKIIIAVHNHANLKDPNQIARPESFQAAFDMSRSVLLNLDIGHFTAANYDPLSYIEKHHERITNIHLKDRKRDNGPNLPWGEGDTPIKQALQLIQRRKYPIPAMIEWEYQGSGRSLTEVPKCLAYAKAALA